MERNVPKRLKIVAHSLASTQLTHNVAAWVLIQHDILTPLSANPLYIWYCVLRQRQLRRRSSAHVWLRLRAAARAGACGRDRHTMATGKCSRASTTRRTAALELLNCEHDAPDACLRWIIIM